MILLLCTLNENLTQSTTYLEGVTKERNVVEYEEVDLPVATPTDIDTQPNSAYVTTPLPLKTDRTTTLNVTIDSIGGTTTSVPQLSPLP